MPRTPRVELAGGIHHVTARSPSGRQLFGDEHDCAYYLGLVARQVEVRAWNLLTYCLMGNHLHLLIRTPEPDLGAGIKAAHETFATATNRRRAEHGHLFGSRFFNRVVVEQRHFEACLRYIARNPVAAGLCARAGEWRWTAHRALMGEERAPDFLDVDGSLSLIHDSPDAARISYGRWVEQPDLAVLATLEATLPGDTWLVAATEGHRVPLEEIMAFKGWSKSTVYARLRAARRTEGTVP